MIANFVRYAMRNDDNIFRGGGHLLLRHVRERQIDPKHIEA